MNDHYIYMVPTKNDLEWDENIRKEISKQQKRWEILSRLLHIHYDKRIIESLVVLEMIKDNQKLK